MIATIAWILVSLFTLLTVLPRVRNDFWTFRILEYPRLQKLVLGLVILSLVWIFRHELEGHLWWMSGILVACCSYLIIKIIPYTAAAPKEMKRVAGGKRDCELVMFTANVLQDNRDFDRLGQQIRSASPDLIFLVETDQAWADSLSWLEKEYPHTLKCPLDNTYGLLFYSRFPLQDPKVLFRAEADVPSIKTRLQLPCGAWITIFGLHPKPPVPHESLYSTAKDKELMKVAFEVESEKTPCVVMGDLNDVAWSHVTELFRKVSGLLDPRRGRGFYSTFSANHWWMRFPLDYIFCSSEFGLVKMKRLPHNGSDHFAMVTHLQYNQALEAEQPSPEADAQEEEEALEKAEG